MTFELANAHRLLGGSEVLATGRSIKQRALGRSHVAIPARHTAAVAVRITATGRLRRLLRHARLSALIIALLVALPSMVECGAPAGGASAPAKQRVAWVDQNVNFTAGGLTIYA